MLDITYKTAWFMAHRIRFAKGTVEADETFDQAGVYIGLQEYFKRHAVVNHSVFEYARRMRMARLLT